MGEKRTQATGRPPQPRGLVVAAALLLGASLAVMALPRTLGFQDPQGLFLKVGLSVLFTTIVGGFLAFASPQGIRYSGTTRREVRTRYEGWRPTPPQPGDIAYLDSITLGIGETAGRFPGPIRLPSSPGRWLFLLVTGLVLCLVSLAMIKDSPVYGWIGLVFFGVGVIKAGVELLPGAGALRLDEHGFEVTNLFRRHGHGWADVSSFGVWNATATTRFVVFDVIGKEGLLADINTISGRRTGGLPETYGFTAGDLARLMNYWRASALARSAADRAASSAVAEAEVAALSRAALNSPS